MLFARGHRAMPALVAAVVLAVPAAAFAHDEDHAPRSHSFRAPLNAPDHLHTTVVPGQKAIEVTWDAVPLATGYDVLVDGDVVVSPTVIDPRRVVVSSGLVVGHTYEISVRGTIGPVLGAEASTEQVLYIAPVTTVQKANPSNPLAGVEWGVYTGLQDQAVIGWNKLGSAQRDALAPIPMIHKATYFGRWIPDDQAETKVRAYIDGAQGGDPSTMTILTLFRMFPWEGEARIDQRLPTAAEQASYRSFVTGLARGIGDDLVTVVLQPDGYFAKKAYDAFVTKLGKKKALLPARMLAWTAKTLTAQPRTEVYVDMGSEDWARGDVAPVAKFLRLSGVKYARGFSLNVSHKNYLDREIKFAQEVSQALAKMGLPGKHAILETSDNGQPFHGSELNPSGAHQPDYTPPGEINPCRKKNQKTLCTALGVPPTTDVDNPLWGLTPAVGDIAARYVDAYVWVSRPWLPDQGAGGTKFSPTFATRLLKTWEYSPYFQGTP